jgi:hypothetical protein
MWAVDGLPMAKRFQRIWGPAPVSTRYLSVAGRGHPPPSGPKPQRAHASRRRRCCGGRFRGNLGGGRGKAKASVAQAADSPSHRGYRLAGPPKPKPDTLPFGAWPGNRTRGRYLVDSASSHMLVSKIKPCMSKYKQLYCETANGSLNQLSFI